jgi:pSer/pThr/pTyr-binding forkhead associated (FHA) protein
MTVDPNKKSPRNFQCRDVLWDRFEQMAIELECSVDYLINDAMKQYARQRNYTVTGEPGPVSAAPIRPEVRGPSVAPGRLPAPPIGGASVGAPGARGGLPLPPPPGRLSSSAANPRVSVPPPRTGSFQAPPPPIPREPPNRAPQRDLDNYPTNDGYQARGNGFDRAPQREARAAGSSGQLSVVYQGERTLVSKERFVIGRGKQSSDLTLKDPNVSRQHAMVEYQNGAYFIVDMGSTNGVEHNGQRIARKQISEGDTFRICDHELRFTFR